MTVLTQIVEIKGIRPAIIAILVGICCWSAYLGIAGMTVSPVFTDQYDDTASLKNFFRIKSIAGVPVTPLFFLREPLFAKPGSADRWWLMHSQVEEALTDKQSAAIDYGDYSEAFSITYLSAKEAVHELKLIYFMGFVYVLGTVAVYYRYRNTTSFLLTLFLMGGGIYIFSTAPLYESYLSLPVRQLKPLTATSYLASCLMVAGIHFTLVFPRPKPLIKRFPILLPLSLYAYCVVVPILYLFVVGTDLSSYIWPLFVIFCGIIVTGWVHSIVTERDAAFRKQLLYSLAIPIGGPVVLPTIFLQPDLFGLATAEFSHLTLLFLIFLIAVVLFFDTTCSYCQRVRIEQQSNRQKEELRRDLHDGILNKLASISALSEASIYLMEENNPEALEKVRSIRSQIAEQSQYARGVLWITDRQCDSWDEYFAKLRHCGNDLAGDHGIEFELDCSNGELATTAPTLQVKVCLYYVLTEAISNAIKHARANRIFARFAIDRHRVSVSIADNGIGMAAHGAVRCLESADHTGFSHRGLNNMRDRVRELGGTLSIASLNNGGTRISLSVPVQAESLPA